MPEADLNTSNDSSLEWHFLEAPASRRLSLKRKADVIDKDGLRSAKSGSADKMELAAASSLSALFALHENPGLFHFFLTHRAAYRR